MINELPPSLFALWKIINDELLKAEDNRDENEIIMRRAQLNKFAVEHDLDLSRPVTEGKAEPNPTPTPPPPTPTPSGDIDENGVKMLFRSKPGGPAYFYKMTDDIESSKFIQTDDNPATLMTDGNIKFQRLKAGVVHYKSGEGKTTRVNINAGGFITKQVHTWKDQGVAWLWTTSDSKDAEFTYYFRANNKVHEHTECSSKFRMGIHTGNHDPRASCSEISFKIAIPEDMKSSQEYNHPDYVYGKTIRHSDNKSESNQWIGRKTVVWNRSDGKVQARDYIDWDPFTPEGHPSNNWLPLQEQVYEAITKQGYNKAPVWGGAFCARIDGHESVDYSIISIREIIPPAE